ncbi:uncharacterized protein [Prorops nasuta]
MPDIFEFDPYLGTSNLSVDRGRIFAEAAARWNNSYPDWSRLQANERGDRRDAQTDSREPLMDQSKNAFFKQTPRTEDVVDQVRKVLRNGAAGPNILANYSSTPNTLENHVSFSENTTYQMQSIPEKTLLIEKKNTSLGNISEDEDPRSEGTSRDEFQTSGSPNQNRTNGDYQSSYQSDATGAWDSYMQEAANFGLRAMNDLYYIKEPQLYSMGLYLSEDNPARYVAAFNGQTEEARNLARYGYAILQGTTMFAKKFPDITRNLSLFRNSAMSTLQRQCPSRGKPRCPPASLKYRTSDGSCNNLEHLWWGSAMSSMQRFLPAAYQDGIQSVRRAKNGRPLPSAREVTNLIHQHRDVPLASITHMLMQWGQFVDHDITATAQSRGFNGTVPQCCLNGGAGFQPPEFMHPHCLPIAVSSQDNFFGSLGVRCLEFVRSGPAPRENCGFGPREQLTQVTSFLDASTVYSSNALQSDSLRIFRSGLLQYGRLQSRTSASPRQDNDLCRRGSLSSSCFRAGDGRLTEQPALTSLHVAFLRLHNRFATELSVVNPHWSDEKLFQETRKIVAAIVQHITYREFLPIVLGPEVMKIFDLEVLKKGYYEGYDPEVNPTIANGFSSAAYRFGHSMVQQSFVRYTGEHQPMLNNVTIHEEFSNPANLETVGSVDRILLGLVNQPSQKRDEFIAEELTNHLFQTPHFRFGMDLASLNIQRGRDHGIPAYVSWREPCGLSPIETFEDLERVMPLETVEKFKLLYSSASDIDLFSAGLAENSLSGGLVGPTFACIIAQQFGNLRRGDRFWYENFDNRSSFTPGQLQQIRRVTLAQVLCKTMDSIETIQPFVFLLPDNLKNRRVPCQDETIGQMNLEPWTEKSNEVRTNWGSLFGGAEEEFEPDAAAAARPEVSSTSAKPSTRETELQSRRKVAVNRDQTKQVTSQAHKPVRASIQQNNRIIVRKPWGHPDNFTISVQNNAVNAPVFVNDAIYGSQFFVNQPSTKPSYSVLPPPNYIHAQQRPPHQNYDPPHLNVEFVPPDNFPPAKPIPMVVPSFTSNPHNPDAYYPHRYDDPSNPNPPSTGFRPPTYTTNNIIYETYSVSSPRPTLYTYYTNPEQRPTPQPMDNYEDHSANYIRPSVNIEYNVPNGQHLNAHYHPDPWQNPPSSYGSIHGEDHSYDQRPSSYETNAQPQSHYSHTNEHYGGSSDWGRPPASYQPGPAVISVPENWNGLIIHEKPSRPVFQDNVYYQGPTEESPTHYDHHVSLGGGSGGAYVSRPTQLPKTSYHLGNLGSKPVSLTATTLAYQPSSPSKPSRRPSKRPVTHHGEQTTHAHPPNRYKPTKRPPGHHSSGTKIPTKRPQVTVSFSDEWVGTQHAKHSGKPNDKYYTLKPNSVSYPETWRDDASQQAYRSTPSSHKENRSTIGSYQQVTRESTTSKPPKAQSVAAVTVDDEQSTRPVLPERKFDKVKTEVPRPLKIQPKNGDGPGRVGRPGQFYYMNNVLHRYQDTPDDQPNENSQGHEGNQGNRSKLPENLTLAASASDDYPRVDFMDSQAGAHVIRDDKIKLTTTATIVVNNEEEKRDKESEVERIYVKISSGTMDDSLDDINDRMKESISKNMERLPVSQMADGLTAWVNPEEDASLPSLMDMPKFKMENTTKHEELPRPMKLQNYTS